MTKQKTLSPIGLIELISLIGLIGLIKNYCCPVKLFARKIN